MDGPCSYRTCYFPSLNLRSLWESNALCLTQETITEPTNHCATLYRNNNETIITILAVLEYVIKGRRGR